jgi:tRNA(Ile)-lysidine synthase
VSAQLPAAAEPESVTAAEFAAAMARFAPFEPRPSLAVAVSGGPDSMALAWLARDWVRAQGGALLALIVDHGLRPGSADEARRVRARLLAAGIPAEVLTWQPDTAATRLEERARAARYALLREACRRHGILHLLTGHHLDDQLETVAMREARGSGPVGLMGMPAERFFAEVRLLRPLLTFPRARLAATVRQAGLVVEQDPLNLDLRFARARLRATGVDRTRLLQLRDHAVAVRREREEAVARLACCAVTLSPLGWAELARTPFEEADAEIAALLLARLITTVAGREHPPRFAQTWRTLARLRQASERAMTLGGCVLRRRARTWTICREPHAVPRRITFAGPAAVQFDGRFHVWVGVKGWFELASLAEVQRQGLLSLSGGEIARIPAAARLSLPVLLRDGAVVAAPPGYRAARSLPIEVRFLPRRRFLEAVFA